MEKIILIKYGELTTKKDNRKTFIKILENNIKTKIKDLYIEITKTMSRMYITYKEENEKEIIEKLTQIFGIHSIVICEKTNTNEGSSGTDYTTLFV